MKVIYLYFISHTVPFLRCQVVLCALFYCLGPDIEVPKETESNKVSSPVTLFLGLHQSKRIVVKLSALFMLDAFAGSFVLQSIMSGWFHVRYLLIDEPFSHIRQEMYEY